MAICLTIGEQSENHIGMQINGYGLAREGFTIKDLTKIKKKLETKQVNCEFIKMNDYLNEEEREDTDEAGVLIIRNGIDFLLNLYDQNDNQTQKTATDILNEQLALEWDKEYIDKNKYRTEVINGQEVKIRGKILNKRARYNLCYGNVHQDADIKNGKGTIIAYNEIPLTTKWKDGVSKFIGKKAKYLEMEGNYYYDVKKCGIGFHGDAERKKVIAGSLGESRPIHWQWYHRTQPIGKRIEYIINNGDMYIMSEKASGFDWKYRFKKTLRHAAGQKYVNVATKNK